ncbi:hypothetical protein FRC10_004506 [Ceratobasidium sp. 414]|nr:hypothetical protein FRC10_004506 [Ceratobasidium sp. 414]
MPYIEYETPFVLPRFGWSRDAMGQWKAARSQLTAAVDTFYEACVTLEAAADWTRTTLGDYSSAETIIRDVAACLPNIKSYRRHLYSAELILCRTFNSSTSLVPISKLPPELLCSILSLVLRSSPCIVDNLSTRPDDEVDVALEMLVVIQLVCNRWHHLVLNTPSFWSHVDVLGNYTSTSDDAVISELTHVRLKRAAGAPTCLHFHESVREYPDSRVALFLRPYLHNSYSVVLPGDCNERLFLTISEACSSHCAPDLIRPINAPGNDLPQAAHPDWPKRTFYGITDLRMGYTGSRMGSQGNSYQLEHLLAMLSSNPLIRILRLRGIPPYFDRDDRNPTLISLPDLEVLEIENVRTDCTLLSKLKAGTVGLDLRLDAPGTEEDLIAVRSFSERSRIKSLTVKTGLGMNFRYLNPCISSMPHLRALFLDDSTTRDSELMKGVFLTGRVPYIQSLPTDDCIWGYSASFPNLKVIGLAPSVSWRDTSVLQLAPLVTAYSLDLLVLTDRYAPPDDPPCDPTIWSWVSKRVKSTALLRKNTGYSNKQYHDEWDLFMETLRLG